MKSAEPVTPADLEIIEFMIRRAKVTDSPFSVQMAERMVVTLRTLWGEAVSGGVTR